jgi:hypothetical protein
VAKFAQVALCAFVVSCAPARSDGPNFLVVVWDDVGTDKVGAYQEHPNPPATPNLDALAAEGMLFQRAYANPFCSPTRAGLVTGRHAFRYGIGSYLTTRSGWSLLDDPTERADLLTGSLSADAQAALRELEREMGLLEEMSDP